MTSLIEVSGVSKAFGGVIANHEVSLDVSEGRITGLIGPNGSGKTTLFNSIVGYHPIDSGSIRFEGREISKLRVQQIARLGLLVPLDMLPSNFAVRAPFNTRPRSLSQVGCYLVNPKPRAALFRKSRASSSSLLVAGASQV